MKKKVNKKQAARQKRIERAQAMMSAGYRHIEIAKQMGISETDVRLMLQEKR